MFLIAISWWLKIKFFGFRSSNETTLKWRINTYTAKYTGFAKAFDKVNYGLILQQYEINVCVLHWRKFYLYHRMLNIIHYPYLNLANVEKWIPDNNDCYFRIIIPGKWRPYGYIVNLVSQNYLFCYYQMFLLISYVEIRYFW